MNTNSHEVFVIIGLGNPDDCHENNRHNIGHMFIDHLSEKFTDQSISDYQKKFSSLINKANINGHKSILVKPQTYMNLSGQSALQIKQFYKTNNSHIIVIHDELDIDFMVIKNKTGGGNAGHNGLKNISNKVENDYHRIRIGIGHPRKLENYNKDVAGYVLEDFNKDEKEKLDLVYQEAEKQLEEILTKVSNTNV